jgi:hypothetical protein
MLQCKVSEGNRITTDPLARVSESQGLGASGSQGLKVSESQGLTY